MRTAVLALAFGPLEADFTPLEFSQRFTGTFSADGRRIDGRWESAQDGSDWELDFPSATRGLADRLHEGRLTAAPPPRARRAPRFPGPPPAQERTRRPAPSRVTMGAWFLLP